MTDPGKDMASNTGRNKASLSTKDAWDKAEILFKSLSGLLAAILIGVLGFVGNNYLQKKQERDSDIKLYTQILSNKEASENSLRKDMFGQILLSFLTPKEKGSSGKQPTLKRVREMRLSLDLLARNFHESLDMKPLFKHLLMEIVRSRGMLKRCLHVVDDEQKADKNIRDTCEGIKKRLHEELSIGELMKGDQHVKTRLTSLVKRFDRELDLLIDVARRVARKQREVLEDVAGTIHLEIPISERFSPKKICTKYKPTDWLPKDKGICETTDEKGRVISLDLVEGYKKEATLRLHDPNEEIEEKELSRYFQMKVRYLYPRWKQVFVEILTCPKKEGCPEKPDDDPEKNRASFWLDHFDFPQVDSTYLNENERFSVILEGFKKGKDGEAESAKITLLYYPAAYAGLKEKSFYNNQVMRGLLHSDLFKGRHGS